MSGHNDPNLIGLPEGFPVPELEYHFNPERKWAFDYAWPEAKVAVEIEGGIWKGGRHVHPSGFLKDIEKYNHAAADNWLVLRFPPGAKGFTLGKVDWDLVSKALFTMAKEKP
jgi:hypothetical protein